MMDHVYYKSSIFAWEEFYQFVHSKTYRYVPSVIHKDTRTLYTESCRMAKVVSVIGMLTPLQYYLDVYAGMFLVTADCDAQLCPYTIL